MTNKKIVQSTDKPKPPNAGKGRPAGVPNRVTGAFRETVNRLLDDNAKNVSQWLKQVAIEDPAKAIELMAKLAEYAVPKLARTEVSGNLETTPPSLQVNFHSQQTAVLAALEAKHQKLSSEQLAMVFKTQSAVTGITVDVAGSDRHLLGQDADALDIDHSSEMCCFKHKPSSLE